MAHEALSFPARLALACACFFKLLFDGRFAFQVGQLRDGTPLAAPTAAEAPAPKSDPTPVSDPTPLSAPAPPAAEVAEVPGALMLLGVLQREGRLIDFLQQDVADFDDEDIGAAARQVHEGCRRALDDLATVKPLRDEAEESRVTIAEGYDAGAVKLTGNVSGNGPYRGTLVHRGWQVTDLSLPQLMAGHDASIVAAAEVEVA